MADGDRVAAGAHQVTSKFDFQYSTRKPGQRYIPTIEIESLVL
jgi:hypothetical protein